MIVSISQFDTYSGNYENAQDVVAMKTSMLMTAQNIVEEYLGYTAESGTRTDTVQGIGTNHLYLFAQPITAVSSVSIRGGSLTSEDYAICGNYLKLNNGVWPNGEDVTVTYTAGWSAQNLPDLIKMTILQIATLLLQESGGNIGITSKSFSEDSRTFINYTNFAKWLKKLDPYRIVRLYG